MSSFQQNIFSQQLGISNPMQTDPLQAQMNANIQNLELIKKFSQNSNQNLNQPLLYQMPQQIFNTNPNPNKNINSNNPNNLDTDYNPILNFNLNKESQESNMNNNNTNLNNDTTNNDNLEINPFNQDQENDIPINLNKNKNKNKKKNKKNQNLNPLSNSDSEENNKEPPKKTKLKNKFSFLYRITDNLQYQPQKEILAKEKYESQVKKIAEFDTIEDFWDIFQHLRKPDSCRPGIEFFMFKEPVKPLWEDENNKNGGRFSIKLKQGYTTIIWEEMIFTLIGGILPEEIRDEINGIVVMSKKEFNTLQIWFKTFDTNITSEIEKCLRDILVIPEEVKLEPKQFNVTVNNNNINNNSNNNNTNNNSINKNNNNKKEYGNYNKSNKNNNNKNKNNNKGGEFREKGYYNNNKNKNKNNNNYYYEDDGYGNYNNNKEYRKNKYQNRKNKK